MIDILYTVQNYETFELVCKHSKHIKHLSGTFKKLAPEERLLSLRLIGYYFSVMSSGVW